MKKILTSKKTPVALPTERISILYFTDPICSHCWAMEPQLQKFLYHYGDQLDLHIIMGGLLERWDGFSDPSNDIESAGDVYRHWREVGEQSGMPIRASLWLSDPIHSSYPASQVINLVEKYHPDQMVAFLRRLREAVFVFDENVAREEVLEGLLREFGLEGEDLLKKAFGEEGQKLLLEDLDLTRKFRVRSFPTVVFSCGDRSLAMAGERDAQELEEALLSLVPGMLGKKPIPPLTAVLQEKKRLYFKEIEVLYDLNPSALRSFLKKSRTENVEEVEFYDGYYLEWKA